MISNQIWRGEICHEVLTYVEANNKYMKKYNKIKDSPYLTNFYKNILQRMTISPKLDINGFERDEASKTTKDFFLNLWGYFLRAELKYPEQSVTYELPFAPDKMFGNKHEKNDNDYNDN